MSTQDNLVDNKFCSHYTNTEEISQSFSVNSAFVSELLETTEYMSRFYMHCDASEKFESSVTYWCYQLQNLGLTICIR